MKLISWNVNGIRACVNKGFNEFFNNINADIFLYGHTHVYKLEKHDEHFFINPGSTTLPKEGNVKTYMIYDLESDTISLYSLSDDSMIKSLELR